MSESLELGVFIVLVVFGPLGLQVLCLYAATRWSNARLMRVFGWRALLLVSWIGTPIHEFSHALAALVLGAKIKELDLFKADKSTGELGSVAYSFGRRAPLREGLVAVAPLVGGTAALMLVTYLFMPGVLRLVSAQNVGFSRESLLSVPAGLGSAFMRNFTDLVKLLSSREVLSRWQTWAWVYLVLCIGTRLAPSRVDLRHIGRILIVSAAACFLLAFVVVVLEKYGGLQGTVGAARVKEGAARVVMAVNSCFSLTLLLCVFASLLIFAATLPFSRRAA